MASDIYFTLVESIPLKGSTGGLPTNFAFSPDGLKVVVAFRPEGSEQPETIEILDRGTNGLTRVIAGPQEGLNRITDLKYLPDGRHVVSCSNQSRVKTWNVDTATRVIPRSLQEILGDEVAIIPFSHEIIADTNVIAIFDALTGELISNPSDNEITDDHIALSPDGVLLAATNSMGDTVRIIDLRSGKITRSFDNSAPITEDGKEQRRIDFLERIKTMQLEKGLTFDEAETYVQSQMEDLDDNPIGSGALAFSPDGSRIAAASATWFDGAVIQVWNPRTGESLQSIEIPPEYAELSEFTIMLFLPDNNHLMLRSDFRTWIIDVDAGTISLVDGDFPGHSPQISPDGTTLCMINGDTLDFWEIEICPSMDTLV